MGDWLREMVEREFVVETTGWAPERANRVAAVLQRQVPADRRLEVLVVWLARECAFTAPGRTIYFSRRLLECCADDDAAAFVIAHELAHHELGHVGRGWRRLFSFDREAEADRRAVELCLSAGYDLERCLEVMQHISHHAFDHGDVDAVLGEEDRPWWRGRRSHPPIAARMEAARAHARRVHDGTADTRREVAEARRRARVRTAMAVASAVGAAALLLIVRR
jgi:predicted Zn-dependent protease